MTNATATRKPRKGDTIFLIGRWSDGSNGRQASAYYRAVRVESWGAKRGTGFCLADNHMIRDQIWVNRVEFATTEEQAREMARDFAAKMEAEEIRAVDRWTELGRPVIADDHRRILAQGIRVDAYGTLLAELRAERA